MSKKFWKINNQADDEPAELLLYGDIANTTWFGDEITPKQFADDIRALGGKDITVRINSGGGDVFAAQSIHNQLKSYAGTVNVMIDGICASAATIIACAGKTVTMPSNAIFMIHNPSVGVCDWLEMKDLEALSKQLEAVKQTIVNVYLQRVGANLTEVQIKHMMDKEAWMTADEALGYGFVDIIDSGADMSDVSNKIIGMRNFKSSAEIRQIVKERKESADMDSNKILNQIKKLLGGNEPQNNAVDPVIAERQRMIALDELNDGSEIVAKIVNIAKQNGNTAEEIREYVDAVKSQPVNSARDKGIEEIKKLVRDNMASGAAQISTNPADNTSNAVAEQEKKKNFDDVLAAMNKARG